MDSGFNLSASSASRIGKMLRDYENGRLGRRPDPGQVTPSVGVGNSFVKVTGTNAAYPAGDYVGEFTWFDTSDGLWHSQFDPVRVREVNGATLTVGSKYVGEYVETIAGIEVFAVQASGGGGAAAADNGARFVQFTDRAGTFGIYNGFMLTWNSSGVAQGSGVSVFIQAWGTNSLPVVPSAGQYEIALKISDAYTAPGTPGGANITKPLYVVYGQGYPPPSCVVKPTRETTLLGTYYGELSVISGAGLTGITWADTTGREVLIHNINSTGVAGSLTVNKRYMGILSGSSFASGTAFGAQLNGYPIYTVAAP